MIMRAIPIKTPLYVAKYQISIVKISFGNPIYVMENVTKSNTNDKCIAK